MIRVIVEGLVKRYGKTTAIDRASLEIRPGELLFVVGPPGAGKSTLARLIAGLETADEGEIYIDDKLVNTMPAGSRRIALIARDGALWPKLTVAENVAYPYRYRRSSNGAISGKLSKTGLRERTRELLNLFRIDSLADRMPSQLDPVQSMKAAMARALITQPELLIFDEPAVAIEPGRVEEFRADLTRIQASHSMTILALTRDVRISLCLADRVAVMDLGKIVQAGPPQDLYNRPSDVFVARFLGPVNLLQGQVDAVGTNPQHEVVVRTPLGRLFGRAEGNSLAPGSSVTIAIRPEAVSLGGTIQPGANRFPATIERVTFLGDVRQVQLRGPGDWPFLAVALQSQSRHLREGQSLTLSVSPEYVVVLPGKYTVSNPSRTHEARG